MQNRARAPSEKSTVSFYHQGILVAAWSAVLLALRLSGATNSLPAGDWASASTLAVASLLGFVPFVRWRKLAGVRWNWKGGIARWLSWQAILVASTALLSALPIYQTENYRSSITFFWGVTQVGWIVGAPYCILTCSTHPGLRWDRSDPAVGLLVFLRSQGKKLKALLPFQGWWVRLFFLPVMLSFLDGNLRSVDHAFYRMDSADLGSVFEFLMESIFWIDVILSLFGYVVATRWLNSPIRSTEATLAGVAFCLACYPPFNSWMNQYLVWPHLKLANDASFPGRDLFYGLSAGLLLVYLWATFAFGSKFSNLTWRGLVSVGPYRWVRHPAYSSKVLSWWCYYLPSFLGPHGVRAAFFMLGWSLIYFVRAMTEERHLRRFDEYRRYCESTPHRFIPRLF